MNPVIWPLMRSGFSYLRPLSRYRLRKPRTTFVAIFRKYISFCRLGSIFKQNINCLKENQDD